MRSTTRRFTILGRMAGVLCASALIALSFSARSQGGLFTLLDGNSVANFSTASQAGAYGWSVDGISQLYQQWFWFRVGNNPEASIDTLPIQVEGVNDTNGNGLNDTLFVRYVDPAGKFRIEVRY